jgi:hypothetical protein
LLTVLPALTMTEHFGASNRYIFNSSLPWIVSKPWRRNIPDGKQNNPYKALLESDMKTVMAGGEKALVQIFNECPCRNVHRCI